LAHKTDKPQQQTLSVRISEPLRRRLERTKQLVAAKTGESVSTPDIAKQLLESAREDRLEVVDLMAEPTKTLLDTSRRHGSARDARLVHPASSVVQSYLGFDFL
jgi:hypothetical protein